MKTSKNPEQLTIAERIANRVFTHHGNYTEEPRTGEVMMAVSPTIQTRIGRLGLGLFSAFSAGAVAYEALQAKRPSEALLLGGMSAACTGMVALTGYDHLLEANLGLPNTVEPQAIS